MWHLLIRLPNDQIWSNIANSGQSWSNCQTSIILVLFFLMILVFANH